MVGILGFSILATGSVDTDQVSSTPNEKRPIELIQATFGRGSNPDQSVSSPISDPNPVYTTTDSVYLSLQMKGNEFGDRKGTFYAIWNLRDGYDFKLEEPLENIQTHSLGDTSNVVLYLNPDGATLSTSPGQRSIEIYIQEESPPMSWRHSLGTHYFYVR